MDIKLPEDAWAPLGGGKTSNSMSTNESFCLLLITRLVRPQFEKFWTKHGTQFQKKKKKDWFILLKETIKVAYSEKTQFYC